MKPNPKDLALLVSVVGIGLTTTAQAQVEVAAEPGRLPVSDWDWVPGDIAAAGPFVSERDAIAAIGREADRAIEARLVSDWDWSPAAGAGAVTAQKPVVPKRGLDAGVPQPDESVYDHARYTIQTLSLDKVETHLEQQRQQVEEAALLAAVRAFAGRMQASAAPADLDSAALAEANDVDERIAAFVHDAMPVFDHEASAAGAATVAAAPPAVDPVETAVLPALGDAPQIAPFVVATHTDKVLLSLMAFSDTLAPLAQPLPSPDSVQVGADGATSLDSLFALPAIDAPAIEPVEALAQEPADGPAPAKRRKAKKPKPVVEPVVHVASHGDKVLLSLDAILGAEQMGSDMLQPREVAVLPPVEDEAPRASPFGDAKVAVAEGQLDRVRGGFSTPNLQISFGIERAVYVNGNLVTTTSLNMSQLGQVTGGQQSVPGSLALIQSGSGNTFFQVPTGNGNNVATVIQNTLNDQKIQSVTQVNAVVNSLQILKGMNLQQSLRGAVIDSLRR